jgi:hypothetical protein
LKRLNSLGVAVTSLTGVLLLFPKGSMVILFIARPGQAIFILSYLFDRNHLDLRRIISLDNDLLLANGTDPLLQKPITQALFVV